MGLLKTTEQTYYSGDHVFYLDGSSSTFVPTDLIWTYNLTGLFDETPTGNDIRVYFRSDALNTEIEIFGWTVSGGIISISNDGFNQDGYIAHKNLDIANARGTLRVELLNSQFGTYRYTSLKDIVSSFMVAYVGDGKLIDFVNKSDVIFHAKRGLQEFSYDVLKTVKIQEIELNTSLSMPMPQDYVSYVKVCYIDSSGVKRIIYPTTLTINPTETPLQDQNYNYIYDSDGNIIEGSSLTEARWDGFDTNNITGNLTTDEDTYFVGSDNHLKSDYGRRYGLEPQHQQINGYFTIDEKTGSFAFSSDLAGKVIVLEYVSDSLGTDAEMKVHKFAEEALYKHVAYNVLAAKRNIPEYIVQRYKKERRAALRNAKIRLSKLNLEQVAQIMKGKSKQLKN